MVARQSAQPPCGFSTGSASWRSTRQDSVLEKPASMTDVSRSSQRCVAPAADRIALRRSQRSRQRDQVFRSSSESKRCATRGGGPVCIAHRWHPTIDTIAGLLHPRINADVENFRE